MRAAATLKVTARPFAAELAKVGLVMQPSVEVETTPHSAPASSTAAGDTGSAAIASCTPTPDGLARDVWSRFWRRSRRRSKRAFYDLACTAGAFLVLPVGTYVDGKLQQSVNQRRGMHPQVRDRFNLTLECIRRHYAGSDSPLGKVLAIHADFFNLFEKFREYVEYFLLQDLVSVDFDSVRFLKNFDDFSGEPLPAASAEDYRRYMRRSMAFTQPRNGRIAAYAALRAGYPERDLP